MGKLSEYEAKRALWRVEAILSVEEDRKNELRPWIRENKFERDLASFHAISEAATYKLNTHWMTAILAALPDKFWSMSEEGNPQLDQTGAAASLRLLSTAWDGQDQQESVLHQAARKEVMQALLDNIPSIDRNAYREMLSWDDRRSGEAVVGDTQFGWTLYELESMMECMVALQERHWRKQNALDDLVTTPVKVRERLSAFALEKTFQFVERCCAYGKDTYKMRDSLLALLSANMSCNRVALEYAALSSRSREALEMTVSFLRALNAQGIEKVPQEFEGASPAECDALIFTCLQRWFGHKGDFIAPASSFAKHMTKSDVQTVIDLSRQLQDAYIASRGSNPLATPDQARNDHGGSANRFIFALVLAAAFYRKARTDQEFVVGKNAMYAVFPDRQSIKQGRLLTIHAIDVLLKAYGLVFFGNSGWNLLPRDVEQYAQGTETRRLHNQVAILCAVKGRTSAEIMGLYENLKELPANRKSVFERLGMSAIG